MAVDATERSKPEIILLDIEMPEVDGLAALPMILKAHPTSKVIVISTLTQRNAEISLKCLSLGAVDYLAKPESARAAGAAADFRRDLIAKLRALGETKSRQARLSTPALSVLSTPPAAPAPKPGSVKPQCLLIGSSTGGPRAVERVLLDLKPALPSIPVLIVQHMPAMFTAVFAEHLQSFLAVPAREARDGDVVTPGTILVAPGGRHMGVVSSGGKAVIRLSDVAPENFAPPWTCSSGKLPACSAPPPLRPCSPAWGPTERTERASSRRQAPRSSPRTKPRASSGECREAS
jgi:two-component system chemotaxis response regulator CheB